MFPNTHLARYGPPLYFPCFPPFERAKFLHTCITSVRSRCCVAAAFLRTVIQSLDLNLSFAMFAHVCFEIACEFGEIMLHYTCILLHNPWRESTLMSVPRCFVWTRFGTEAGQTITEILRRKERERVANDGVFYWGIGNAVGPSILELLRQSDEPEVLFSPVKSVPRRDDVTPKSVVAWTAAAGLDGKPHHLPLWSLITSKFTIGRQRHYALVCRSDSSLVSGFGSVEARIEKIAIGALTNLVTGRPLGASQVTAVVRRRTRCASPAAEYTVDFRAKLVPPFFIHLSAPQPITVSVACSWGNLSMEQV
jgi:hypothetical protein